MHPSDLTEPDQSKSSMLCGKPQLRTHRDLLMLPQPSVLSSITRAAVP